MGENRTVAVEHPPQIKVEKGNSGSKPLYSDASKAQRFGHRSEIMRLAGFQQNAIINLCQFRVLDIEQ